MNAITFLKMVRVRSFGSEFFLSKRLRFKGSIRMPAYGCSSPWSPGGRWTIFITKINCLWQCRFSQKKMWPTFILQRMAVLKIFNRATLWSCNADKISIAFALCLNKSEKKRPSSLYFTLTSHLKSVEQFSTLLLWTGL